ncbi:MAG: CBS domain-containing protein [Bradymonadaceae bacterium]|nr:CBS domain-containing protein [Lujinxingiaceae bacterium]
MRRNELITKVMQAADQIQTVHVDQKLSEVRQILAENRFHHVPVLSGDKLVGLISATDMLKMTFTAYGGDDRAFDAYLDHTFKIEDVMTQSLTTVTDHATIREVTALLSEGHYHAVPVVDANDKFVGLVTSTDLVRHLGELYA